ncbi:MAG: hypothetical protein CO094_07735 [Anaerolineae bacterium CG_4_9_14_3_um_filter_57_17]|nr:hypothetical protein [bacterium]NCT19841.1 hypothetical protein [bacterium]OIO84491.1 MAG: hypothetical protein AUK01_09235 [Anaerolineae bacterium CG2_30_57_67]PJB66266.1 MAG: hypothetical protein CO094_07735 [Anaerolineae bacterium CG_4_9_14_3_um_filter_57_17]
MTLNLQQLALVAFLVEALIQTIKPVYDKEKGWNKSAIFSLAMGIVVCLFTNVDLFRELGLSGQIPYVGSVFTGIIASRGSNFAHDIFKYVNGKAQENPMTGGVG